MPRYKVENSENSIHIIDTIFSRVIKVWPARRMVNIGIGIRTRRCRGPLYIPEESKQEAQKLCAKLNREEKALKLESIREAARAVVDGAKHVPAGWTTGCLRPYYEVPKKDLDTLRERLEALASPTSTG